MPGTKRPNRKKKKARKPAADAQDGQGAEENTRPGVKHGGQDYGAPKGGRSHISPAMVRHSPRGR